MTGYLAYLVGMVPLPSPALLAISLLDLIGAMLTAASRVARACAYLVSFGARAIDRYRRTRERVRGARHPASGATSAPRGA